jgi:hypothetical protein
MVRTESNNTTAPVLKDVIVAGIPRGVTISGKNIGIVKLQITEPFIPINLFSVLRLLGGQLSSSNANEADYIDLIAFDDIDLTGWSLQWVDAFNPTTAAMYHQFQSGDALREARIARIYGSTPSGQPNADVDTYFGGAQAVLPKTGAVVQLVNANQHVVHELLLLPPDSFVRQDVTVVPTRDRTRAFLVPSQLTSGLWQVELSFRRDAAPDLARLSVSGDSSDENATLSFLVSNDIIP